MNCYAHRLLKEIIAGWGCWCFSFLLQFVAAIEEQFVFLIMINAHPRT
jgi:hypothetical protein